MAGCPLFLFDLQTVHHAYRPCGLRSRKFWEKKLTLPVGDPFWTKHHPGDRWNCKCSLEQTDDPVNRPDDLDCVDPQQRGLENNPGKDGHTFSDDPSSSRHSPDRSSSPTQLIREYQYAYPATVMLFDRAAYIL